MYSTDALFHMAGDGKVWAKQYCLLCGLLSRQYAIRWIQFSLFLRYYSCAFLWEWFQALCVSCCCLFFGGFRHFSPFLSFVQLSGMQVFDVFACCVDVFMENILGSTFHALLCGSCHCLFPYVYCYSGMCLCHVLSLLFFVFYFGKYSFFAGFV